MACKVSIEEYRKITTVFEAMFFVEGQGCVVRKRLPTGYQFMVGCPSPVKVLGKFRADGGVYQGRVFWPWHSIHRVVFDEVPADEDELESIRNATEEEFNVASIGQGR